MLLQFMTVQPVTCFSISAIIIPDKNLLIHDVASRDALRALFNIEGFILF